MKKKYVNEQQPKRPEYNIIKHNRKSLFVQPSYKTRFGFTKRFKVNT